MSFTPFAKNCCVTLAELSTPWLIAFKQKSNSRTVLGTTHDEPRVQPEQRSTLVP
jgi:hypothetical protein